MNAKNPQQIRDFVDFYHKWPDGRSKMVTLQANPNLSDQERVYLRWLIHLADRVGPADIVEERGHELAD